MSNIYVFDLDHTLCDTKKDDSGRWLYFESVPYSDRIEKVNELKNEGHTIIIETARGSDSKINYYEKTYNQLVSWGLKFDFLRTGVKFSANYYIDDKALNSEDFFNGKHSITD
jgi:hypothetical protein